MVNVGYQHFWTSHCRNLHTIHFCQCRFYGNTACWPLVNCWANLIKSKITRIRVAQPSWSLYHNYRWIPPLWPEHKSLIQFSSVFVENGDQSKVIFPQNQTFVIISIIINNEVNFFAFKDTLMSDGHFILTSISSKCNIKGDKGVCGLQTTETGWWQTPVP